MATELATAYVSLLSSGKGLKGSIESELGGAGEAGAAKTEGAFKKASGRIAGGLKAALTGAAVGGAAVFAGIKIGNEILTSGARLESFKQKAKTVFEESAGDVNKWAKKNSAAFGVTDTELVGLAANFGDLVKPMGFTAKQSADLAKETIGLSGALSSWSGGTKSATEVSDILSKAMLGETEGLKGLGISISQAEIQQKLMERGQDKLTGSALAQAKALATKDLIMAKSTDAQDAYAKGGNKALMAQNKLKNMVGELKETLIEKLMPAVQAGAQWLGDHLPAAGKKVQEIFKAMQPTIQVVVAWLKDNIPPAIEKARAALLAIVGWVKENWPQIKETIGSVIESIKSIITTAIDTITTAWQTWGDNILNFAKGAFGPIVSIIQGAMSVIQGIIKTVTSLIHGDWAGVWEGLKQIVSGAWDAIKGIIGLALQAIKLVIGMAWDVIKGIFSKAWDGIKALIGLAIDGIIALIRGIAGKVAAFAGGLWDSIKNAFAAVKTFIGDRISDIVGFVKGIPGKLSAFVSTLWDGIKEAFKAVKTFVTDGITGIVTFIKGIPEKVTSAAKGMFNGIKEAFKAAVNFIIRGWNSIEFKIPGFKVGPVGYDGFTLGLPDIPQLHTGGMVPGRQGSEVLVKAKAGEQVLTSAQSKMVDRLANEASSSLAPGSAIEHNWYGINDAQEAADLMDVTTTWRMSLAGSR